jgi:hypothetical protein
LSYRDLETLAKTAMREEAEAVNAELKKGNLKLEGYRRRPFAFLKKQMHKSSIDPGFLYAKCIFTESNIEAILSSTLTLANDDLNTKINGLGSVVQTYNHLIWKLISRMCVRSQERFIAKLRSATSNGEPLNLDPIVVDSISEVVFFPTVKGRPTFARSVRSNLNILLSSCFLVGTTASLLGASFPAIVLSLAAISSYSMSLQGMVPKSTNSLHELDMSSFTERKLVRLDTGIPIEEAPKPLQ